MRKRFFRSAVESQDLFDFAAMRPVSAGILVTQDEICQLVRTHRLQNPRVIGYSLVVDQIGGVTCLDDLVAARKAFTSMLPAPHQLYVSDDYPFDTKHLVALPMDGDFNGQ